MNISLLLSASGHRRMASLGAGLVLIISLALPGAGSARMAPARASACRDSAPGAIRQDGLFHDGGPLYLQPSEPDAGATVTLTLRADACDLTAATLDYHLTEGAPIVSLPMRRVGRDATGRYDLWRASVRVGPAGSLFSYRFALRDGAAQLYYGSNGAGATPFGAGRFFIAPGFHVPAWVQSAVFYQIFPDRFKDGNPKNDVRTGEYTYQGNPVIAQPWGALPENPGKGRDFFGGDLAGIIQELDPYLKRTLGVNALYLNPIFQSPSNHKYDTQDYFRVDPHFGTNADLATLVRDAHDASAFAGDFPMRIILDGAFTYSGDSIRWFNREGYYPPIGAYNTQQSPYYSFYTFTQWPDQYDEFGGYASTLPALNYASTRLRDIIYRSPSSVMQTYLRAPYHIDGWRLDSADSISGSGGLDSHQIWADVRRSVKPVAPDSLLLGEVWGQAQPWLDGTQWDGAMNYYGFNFPVSQWVTGQDAKGAPAPLQASELDATLATTLNVLPRPAQLAMLNSLSTHDIPRFLYRAGGDAGKFIVGEILQMTFPGMPSIYYGDEIGMTGATDPDDRRPFIWDRSRWNQTILRATRALVALRKATPALQTGSFTGLLEDDAHAGYAFGRWQAGQRAVTVLNDDASPHRYTIDVAPVEALPGSRWRDALRGGTLTTSATDTITVALPPHSGTVLVQTDGH